MTLTTYDSALRIKWDYRNARFPSGNYYRGFRSGAGATIVATPSSGIGVSFAGERWLAVVTLTSSTASVSSITLGSGINLTRLVRAVIGSNTIEVWGSDALATPMIPHPVATLSASSIPGAMRVVRLVGCSGYGTANTNGAAAGATWSVPIAVPTTTNSSILVCVGQKGTAAVPATAVMTASTPATINGNWDTDGPDPVIWRLSMGVGACEGLGITPKASGTFDTTYDWLAASVVLLGNTVQLDDMTYKLRDTGPLLNNPANTMPIYDVENVDGIGDITATSSSEPLDGADGSYVFAKYLVGKTIVLSGTMYDNPPFDEADLDNLRQCAAPDTIGDGVPFYYKLPGKNLRYLFAKPLGAKINTDRSRTLGQVPWQIQAATEDVRAFELPVATSLDTFVAGTFGYEYAVSLTPTGNQEIYPKFYFNVYPNEITAINSTLYFFTDAWDAKYNRVSALWVDVTQLVAGAYVLNLADRSLRLIRPDPQTYVDYSAAITNRQWWSLIPNVPNAVTFGRNTDGPTAEGFAISYRSAWL